MEEPALFTASDIELLAQNSGMQTGGNADILTTTLNQNIFNHTVNASTTPFVSVLSGGDGQMGFTSMPAEYYNPTSIYQADGGAALYKKILPMKKLKEYSNKLGLKSSQKSLVSMRNYVIGIVTTSMNNLKSLVKNKNSKIGKSHIKKIKM